MKKVYVKLSSNARVESPVIRLSDVAQIICENKEMTKSLSRTKLGEFAIKEEHKTFRKVLSIMEIIDRLQNQDMELEIINLGETDCLVEYQLSPNENKLSDCIKLVLVCILIFFGAAFTIMAFNNDISISGVFEQVYFQLTGTRKPQVSELELAYSLGLFLGITLFFNHIGSKRLTNDVTPIEVELNKHVKDMYDTIVDMNEKEKGR